MPTRATKRGSERTQLERDCDVLICGASFAGLAVARALEGSGAQVLLIDRYEVGERQTSACGIPSDWLTSLDLGQCELQRFDELVVHTHWDTTRFRLPWTFSTFDYRDLCARLREQGRSAQFETATVKSIERNTGRVGGRSTLTGTTLHTVHTDRGELRAPLVVDGLGWRRVLSEGHPVQPPRAPLSRGLEVHPLRSGEEMEIWIDPRYVRAGYAWSFPAGSELRVGVGSFDPYDHVRDPTELLASDLGVPAERYQGNWIPHSLRPAVEDEVFFVGDSAGHCLPLTAEGIRTALYFGLACGRELSGVVRGHMQRGAALARYDAFSDEHAWKFRWMLRAQRMIGRVSGRRALGRALRLIDRQSVVDYLFRHYLDIAPPAFAAQHQLLAGASR